MILVVGATGQLGGLITVALLAQDEPIRALVRGDAAREALSKAGAEAVIGDLKDPESLRRACAGVDTVVTTANASERSGDDTVESVDRLGNRNLIDAAVDQGVRRFVFISALGASPESPIPFLRAKGETEQLVRDSGMAWTVLQPNSYMEKLLLAVVGGPAVAGQPVTVVGEGRRRHSLVAMRDVVAYVAAAIERKEAEGQTLFIGGPEPVSWRDGVAAFEHELGREVPVRTVPMGEPVPGLPEFVSQLLAGMETYDSELDMSGLASLYGVTPTPLADFVRDFVKASLPPAR